MALTSPQPSAELIIDVHNWISSLIITQTQYVSRLSMMHVSCLCISMCATDSWVCFLTAWSVDLDGLVGVQREWALLTHTLLSTEGHPVANWEWAPENTHKHTHECFSQVMQIQQNKNSVLCIVFIFFLFVNSEWVNLLPCLNITLSKSWCPVLWMSSMQPPPYDVHAAQWQSTLFPKKQQPVMFALSS